MGAAPAGGMSKGHLIFTADGKWRNREGIRVSYATPVPPAKKMMMGTIAGSNDEDFNQLQSALYAINPAAKLQIIRRYDGAFPSTWSASSGQADLGIKSTWISFSSPTIAQINSGAYDSTLASFFASIPASHFTMISYIHEIDLSSKIGSTPPEDYASAQERIWNIKQANAQDPSNVLVGPCLTGWSFQQGTHAPFFPASGAFDFVGADPYRFWRDNANGLTSPWYVPDPKSGGTGVQRSMGYITGDPGNDGSAGMAAFAASFGKPIAIGEYGAHPTLNDAQNRPNWLTQTDTYLKANNCIVAVYFHARYGESGPWWLDCYHNYVTITDKSRPDPDSMNRFASLVINNQ